jgi:hypothetical protein
MGQRTVKISITIDKTVLADVRRQLAGDRSLSAYVNAALAEAVRRRNMRALLDDWERTHGPLTEEELESARRKLDRALHRPKRRAKRAA